MKEIKLEQGTPEWLSWRKTVITATDCSCIMGSNPWVTAYKCWQRKLGLVEEQMTNSAMERGKMLEPIARDKFIKEYGKNFSPVVVESEEFNFLGASLDGMSDCKSYILEIKCGGRELFDKAKNGIIPEYYMHQMQHQLLVTNATSCIYYCYYEGEGKVIEVLPDADFLSRYLVKAREFWRGIAFFEPPALTHNDYKNMNDDLSWKEYSRMYQDVDVEIKALKDKKDYLRKKLIELCCDQNSQGNGLKIMKIISKGRIDYDDIPEIKVIDLEKYRKGSTSSWKIMIEKGDK